MHAPPEAVRKFRVDATDIAILRDLGKFGSGRPRSQKATIEEVAEGLGLHPNTVFDRVKRMREGGMLTHFTVLPQPNVVGISCGHFFVTLPMTRRTDALLEQVFQLGCVFNIIETLDGWHVSPVAADDAGLDVLAEKIRAHAGGEPVKWTMRASLDWLPMAPVGLDETDLAIFEALLENAQASLDELAAKLGMNPRTVQRHHERLREAEAFRVYPAPDAMLTGLAFRLVQFDLPAPGAQRQAAEAALTRMLPNHLMRQVITRGMQFILYADEQGELEALCEQAATVPGVTIVFNRQFRRAILSPYYPRQVMEILRAKVRKQPALDKA